MAMAVELRLDRSDEEDAFCIAGHRTLVFEMLSNLADNAICYNRPGGIATIRLEAPGDSVRLSVSDTGPGIPAALRDHAFDRFARLQGEQGPAGSGLGLAIVKAVVERLGAQVELRDAAPGLQVIVTFAAASAPPR